jgi:hypothetical protein
MDVKLGRTVDVPVGPKDDWGGQLMRTDWQASEEATRALARHLHTVRRVLNGEASLNDLGGSYDALVATPEGAALLEQAEADDGDV